MKVDKEDKKQEVDFAQQKIYQALKHRDHPKLPLEVVKVANGYVIGHRRQPYGDWDPIKQPYLEEWS